MSTGIVPYGGSNLGPVLLSPSGPPPIDVPMRDVSGTARTVPPRMPASPPARLPASPPAIPSRLSRLLNRPVFRGIGSRAFLPAYLGNEFQGRFSPTGLYQSMAFGDEGFGEEGKRAALEKRRDTFREDTQKFDGGYGLGEMAQRAKSGLLNPVSMMSANIAGLAELAGNKLGLQGADVDPRMGKLFAPAGFVTDGLYTGFAAEDPMNVGARGEAGAAAVKSGKERLLGRREVISDMFQGLEGSGLEFAPEKFFGANYSGASKNAGRFLAGRPADAQFAESEKEQVMEAERLRAERTQQEGGARSYEDVTEKKQRGTARRADMFFNQADREYLAELAKNDPDRLMTKFDTRGARKFDKDGNPVLDKDGNPVYDSKPDGKLDPEERLSLFNPKTGIKQMRAGDEAGEAFDKASRKAQRRYQRDFDDEVFDDLMRSEKQREDNEKAQRKAERRYQRDFDDEVFSDLMYEGRQRDAGRRARDAGRRALARDLESQFAYSDSPSSAFQNPETREKLMVDAFKRGKELGLRDEQIRDFLRNRNLLDRGFSESYEDFYNRNTQGGGVSTGKLGARRQVGSRGGKVSTEAGRQQQAAANQALMQYIMQSMQPRPALSPRPLFNPTTQNNQFGLVGPFSGGLQNAMPRS